MPKGYALADATKDAIWKLRAQGLSEAEIGRKLGLGPNTVSIYLAKVGGIRPRARRRAERCLSFEEREEISRAIARGQSARDIARALDRSDTTIARGSRAAAGGGAIAPTPRSARPADAHAGHARPSSSSAPEKLTELIDGAPTAGAER